MSKVWPHLEKKTKDTGGDEQPRRLMTGARIRQISTFGGFLLAMALALSVIYGDKTDAVHSADAVTDCDRVASHPADTQKRSVGIPQSDLDVAQAIAACKATLEIHPNDGRALYQLGRVEYYVRNFSESVDHLRRSAETGYAQGQFVYGLLLVRGSNITQDVCAAGAYWIAAARQRHFHSKTYLARAWRNGTFKDCGLAITPEEITAMLAAAPEFVESQAQADELAQVKAEWEAP